MTSLVTKEITKRATLPGNGFQSMTFYCIVSFVTLALCKEIIILCPRVGPPTLSLLPPKEIFCEEHDN